MNQLPVFTASNGVKITKTSDHENSWLILMDPKVRDFDRKKHISTREQVALREYYTGIVPQVEGQ